MDIYCITKLYHKVATESIKRVIYVMYHPWNAYIQSMVYKANGLE